jgi:protein gp37
MAENSKISWTDATFNPWIGCTRVSEGCRNCYAEEMMDRRYGRVTWGPGGARSRTSEQNWRQPRKWDTAAGAAGERRRVFCASLADVFDDHASIDAEWRGDLWRLIAETPNLDWLLLTKRPENWPLFLPAAERRPPFEHVRLGVTMENQDALDERGDILAFAHAAGWPTFISYEPAIGPVHWSPLLRTGAVGWMIVGAESGPRARPFNEDWARLSRDQCAAHGVPFFYKQKIEGRRKIETPELDGRRWVEFPDTTQGER